MVTILPIDVDEEFVRDGLAAAVSQRVEARLRELTEVVAELRGSGIVKREEWENAFAGLAALADEMRPIMEYARCFQDQWPVEDATDA